MMFNYANDPFAMSEARMPQQAPPQERIEEPILGVRDIGVTTTEMPGRQDLIMAAKAEIRKGVVKMELATSQGNPAQGGGAASYGQEARAALRELRKASGIEYTSIHVPSNVGGLSGYNPQQGGFSDEYRATVVDELRKATRFSADTTGGSGVVIHAGEFDRPVSETPWGKKQVDTDADGKPIYEHEFLSSLEEPNRTILRVVDKTNGRVQNLAQKSQTIVRPVWKRAKESGYVTNPYTNEQMYVEKGAYVDYDGLPTQNEFERVPEMEVRNGRPTGEFLTEEVSWAQIEKETADHNSKNPTDQIDAGVYFYRTTMEKNIAQQMGQQYYYSISYEEMMNQREKIMKALEYYKKVEETTAPEDMWKIQVGGGMHGLIPQDVKNPTKYLQDQLLDTERRLKHANEGAAMAKAQAVQAMKESKNHVTIQEYALQQTEKTIAEGAISAYDQTINNPHMEKGKKTFISVENVDPNMYGSHPDEMIDIISRGRAKMVEYMTNKYIERVPGEKMLNPYFQEGMSKEQAAKHAEDHVKMTLDTEHLGLWRKKFMPKPGESQKQTDKRFHNWYLKQVDKLGAANIIGHVHLLDSIDGDHVHVPAGQGDLPMHDIARTLKKHGYKGTIVSEGFGENQRYGADRQATKVWEHFGSPIYSSAGVGPVGPRTMGAVMDHYHGRTAPPMFIFGAYVPSNDYKLWSDVPLE